MLNYILEKQKELDETKRHAKEQRKQIHKNTEDAIARIHADTEARKRKIDETHSHNMGLIDNFEAMLNSGMSAEELSDQFDILFASLKSY